MIYYRQTPPVDVEQTQDIQLSVRVVLHMMCGGYKNATLSNPEVMQFGLSRVSLFYLYRT